MRLDLKHSTLLKFLRIPNPKPQTLEILLVVSCAPHGVQNVDSFDQAQAGSATPGATAVDQSRHEDPDPHRHVAHKSSDMMMNTLWDLVFSA